MSGASSPWGSRQTVLLAAVLAVLAGFSIASDRFRDPSVLLEQSANWVEIGILAPFACLVIVAGGIDLSVGSILALCGVAIVRLHVEGGVPMGVAALAGLLLGTLAGAVNGLIIVGGRIPDLIVTLATMAIFRGLAQTVAQNRVHSNLPEPYRFIGEGLVLGIPVQWLVLAGTWILVFAILHRSTLGRFLYAMGASHEAARLARVPVRGARIAAYAASGFAAALAAVIFTARMNTAKSDDGMGFELDAITCVVLGGASIRGGLGSAPGVFAGFLLLGLLRTGLDLSGVPEIHQRLATGAALILVAAVNERLSTRG